MDSLLYLNQNFTIDDNVLITKPLPRFGIVCANPDRVERLKIFMNNPQTHTHIWGITVYVARDQDLEYFLAAVHLGSGSAFSFHSTRIFSRFFVKDYLHGRFPSPTPSSRCDLFQINLVQNVFILFVIVKLFCCTLHC